MGNLIGSLYSFCGSSEIMSLECIRRDIRASDLEFSACIFIYQENEMYLVQMELANLIICTPEASS